MTNDNNIKRIIQLYFGKHFSRSGRVLFAAGYGRKAELLKRAICCRPLGTFACRGDC